MTIEINSIHIREALAEPVGSIINSITATLEATLPNWLRISWNTALR